MKALQSKLAQAILSKGIRITPTQGAKLVFNGRQYTVTFVRRK